MPSWFAISLVPVAVAIAALFWFVLPLPKRARYGLLVVWCAVLFALPWLTWDEPVWFRGVFVLFSCAVLPPALLTAAQRPEPWQGRSIWKWSSNLLNAFGLNEQAPSARPVRRRDIVQPLVRGLIEIGLGIWLLLWARQAELGGQSFWLDHTVKLLAAYMIAFDGMFVLGTALVRMSGQYVPLFSQHPILAVSPADFWRRYNRDAGRFLYETVFRPAGGHRHPVRGIVLVFFVNAVLHEYLALVLIGKVMGYQMLFFFLHCVGVLLTLRWKPKTIVLRAIGTVGTFAFLLMTTVLFFSNIHQIFPWYSHGSILPTP